MGRKCRQDTFMDDFGFTTPCENTAREPETIERKTIIKMILTEGEM
jgi:hypothetical protein